MFIWWKLWADVLDLGLEARRVIVLRLARIAAGGPAANAECARMVSEKFAAAAAAQTAAAAALAKGNGIDAAANLALAPVRRAVRANHQRLLWVERLRRMRQRLRHRMRRIGVGVVRLFKQQARW